MAIRGPTKVPSGICARKRGDEGLIRRGWYLLDDFRPPST